MIASIVFGTFGLAATLTGMQCSKIGGENYVLKGRIAAIGGVFFFLQGKTSWLNGICIEKDINLVFKRPYFNFCKTSTPWRAADNINV